MTFDPVLPPLALGAIAVALIALRLLTLRMAGSSQGILRWCGMTLAILLVLVAAARPGTGPTSEEVTPVASQRGANVFFVVDRSADSAIGDFGGRPRMSGIRDDIQAVIDSHPGARFAVITFASRPAIDWPLSSDAWSLEPVVEALNPYADSAADSDQVNAAAAANVLRYQLIAAGPQYPQADNLVYYFGSGAARSSATQGVFDTDAVDGGAVYGYGDAPGLDEVELQSIAEQLGVPYTRRVADQPLPRSETPTAQPTTLSPSIPERVEFYWVFTIFASLLVLFEIYLSTRELRRARTTYREVSS